MASGYRCPEPLVKETPSNFLPLDLMTLHVHACYVHDGEHRMVRANEPGGLTAPRFWLGRTREGTMWRFGPGVSVEQIEQLTRHCEQEPVSADFPRTPRCATACVALLADASALPQSHSGPVYWLSRPPAITSGAIALGPDQARLLRGTLDEWIQDLAYRDPIVGSIADSRVVAVCASVRSTDRADEAGVETATGYRGQGHAAGAVAAWAAAVLDRGKVPLYSTSWDNRASQALAHRVGFEVFGEEYWIR